MGYRSICVDRRLNSRIYPFSYLFYTPTFLKVNGNQNLMSFHMLVHDEPQALCEFSLIGQKAISMTHAPFGGVDFRRHMSEQDFKFFVEGVEDELRARGVNEIEFRLPPHCYRPSKISIQSRWLQELGYHKAVSDTNMHIPVDGLTPFRSKLHASEKNKRNKAEKMGCCCEQLGLDQFEEAFALVVKNRTFKGYPVTMEKEHLKKMVQELSAYEIFGCTYEGQLIAVIFGIKVNTQNYYNFYMADDPAYRYLSPLVLLNETVYNHCVVENIQTLDLGTVSVQGELNTGLYDFKKHLGAKTSAKNRLVKSLV